MQEQSKTPLEIKILSIVLFLFGIFAFVGSLFLWGQGFLFSFPPNINYAFPITDILVNAPASIATAIGLWHLKRWGFAAAYFTAGFYLYASVEIFVDVLQSGPPYPIEIVIPQVAAVVVALVMIVVLWRKKDLFNF